MTARFNKIAAWVSLWGALMLFPFAQGQAASAETIKIAKDYLAAYSVFDFEKMRAHYSDDVLFTDPTSLVYGKDNATVDLKGKDVVLNALQKVVGQGGGGTLTFMPNHVFEAGGHVVFQGRLSFEWAGGKVKGEAPITTIIRIQNGQVVEHRDYFDYRTAAASQKK